MLISSVPLISATFLLGICSLIRIVFINKLIGYVLGTSFIFGGINVKELVEEQFHHQLSYGLI